MKNQINTRNKFIELERLAARLSSSQQAEAKVTTVADTGVEAEALHQLFSAATGGASDQADEAGSQAKPSPRMTHQELLAMKESSSKVGEPRVQLLQSALHMLVKGGLTVKGWFVLRDPRRKVCQQIGHECSHCGMRVSYQSESQELPHRS